ncbi:hypothetical protein GUJ93_ZPchr0009g81 [Zizania palustris]|uniref:Uncharacterized protein n=1 Tax=Zizania palustris TaxID=103762 RepID=A0A8J5S6V7_ZIZPA|nr:hypothetical protein GUJ93_ZPchr0009g81 [Zizania palustris]
MLCPDYLLVLDFQTGDRSDHGNLEVLLSNKFRKTPGFGTPFLQNLRCRGLLWNGATTQKQSPHCCSAVEEYILYGDEVADGMLATLVTGDPELGRAVRLAVTAQ